MSELRSNNLSGVTSKQEEIDIATRDAYLYAGGMVMVVIAVLFVHAWNFYFGQNTGMQLRIITIGAIYKKVTNVMHIVGAPLKQVKPWITLYYLISHASLIDDFHNKQIYTTKFWFRDPMCHNVIRKDFSQVLKLSHSTIGQLSIGYIVNLASNDVQRFDLVNKQVYVL